MDNIHITHTVCVHLCVVGFFSVHFLSFFCKCLRKKGLFSVFLQMVLSGIITGEEFQFPQIYISITEICFNVLNFGKCAITLMGQT